MSFQRGAGTLRFLGPSGLVCERWGRSHVSGMLHQPRWIRHAQLESDPTRWEAEASRDRKHPKSTVSGSEITWVFMNPSSAPGLKQQTQAASEKQDQTWPLFNDKFSSGSLQLLNLHNRIIVLLFQAVEVTCLESAWGFISHFVTLRC